MTATDLELAYDLALANRILVRHGVLDAFGHVSARAASAPDHFLLSRNKAPALVEPADILLHGADGSSGQGERLYLERFLHAEIYRARPDVMAIVHSHSPAVIPFGIVEVDLEPVIHTAGFLAEGVSRFDTRAEFGETDLLIRNSKMGASLAGSLGASSVALMRGHGSVAVGASVQHATYRAIYTEMNARVLSTALALGSVATLSSAEGLAADVTNSGQIERLWAVWGADVRFAEYYDTLSPVAASEGFPAGMPS